MLLLSFCLLFASFVSLAHTPQRLVVLSPHLVEWLYDFGVGDRIVAAAEGADYPKQAQSIPSLGRHGHMSVEHILSLKPDLVLAWKRGNRPQLLSRLRHLNIPVELVDSTKVADIPEEMIRVGKAVGSLSQSLKSAKRFEQTIQTLKRQYRQKERIGVFYQLSSKPLATVAQGSWPEQLLMLCGAKNIFDDVLLPYFHVSAERVMQRNPSMIVLPQSKYSIQSNPQWHSFYQDRLVRIDADLLHRPTMRLLSGVTQLCLEIDRIRTKHLSVNLSQ